MRFFLVVATLLSIIGCAQSTGAMKMGPDTYNVTADALGSSNARQVALSEANSHCQGMGKEILVTNTGVGQDRARSVYDVTFKCLSTGDPDLQRPNYESAADIVIKSR